MLLQTPARSSIDPKFLFSEDPPKYSPLCAVQSITISPPVRCVKNYLSSRNKPQRSVNRIFKPLKLSSQDVRQVIISEESRQENENVQRFIQIPA